MNNKELKAETEVQQSDAAELLPSAPLVANPMLGEVIRHVDLINIGFNVRGIEENDPYYQIVFKPPFKFGVANLSGNLNDGIFELYGNQTKYTNIDDLTKILTAIGGEVHYFA